MPPEVDPVYYRFVVRLREPLGPVVSRMHRARVECGSPVYRPLHRYLRQRGFPGAEAFHRRALSVPIYPDLTQRQVERVVAALASSLGGRGGRP